MLFTDNTKHKKERLQSRKRGGEQSMFGSELTIGSVRAQSEHLKRILSQLETDEHWLKNASYYSKEIHEIEKRLRMIRKKDFESTNIY